MADYLFTRFPSFVNDYFGTGNCGHHGDYRQGIGKEARKKKKAQRRIQKCGRKNSR